MGTHHPNDDRQLPSRRHERGRAHLSAVMNYWLTQASLSHDQASAITDWALRESGKLGSSQISHIRNARIRNPSMMLMEALAALNTAIWRWQTKGQDACIELYGPYSKHGIKPEWLDDATWIAHPEHPTEPLCFGDFAELFAGYLTLPGVAVNLSAGDGPELSRALVALLEQVWDQAGWAAREALRRTMDAYPPEDADRRQQLALVIAGQADYSSAQFEQESADLAAMIATLRQLPPADYGPADLHAELTKNRARS